MAQCWRAAKKRQGTHSWHTQRQWCDGTASAIYVCNKIDMCMRPYTANAHVDYAYCTHSRTILTRERWNERDILVRHRARSSLLLYVVATLCVYNNTCATSKVMHIQKMVEKQRKNIVCMKHACRRRRIVLARQSRENENCNAIIENSLCIWGCARRSSVQFFFYFSYCTHAENHISVSI